ncbi:hypothetical protein ES702_01966 [subsurface metagenome]
MILLSHEKRDMSGIIIIFLMMVIGLALTPTVQDLVIGATGVANASYPGNLTGAARAIYLLVPLFWVIIVVAVGLAGIIVWLRGSTG